MSLVDKNIPDVDDDHFMLLLEGQLKAGARLPLSKFVCDVLNHYNKAPINMASSFWHAMRIMDELRSMFHYNIEVADVISFFFMKPCRGDDGTFFLTKRSVWSGYNIWHAGVSNDHWKSTKLFRVRGDTPHSNELITREDPVDLLRFGALTWEAKRKLVPYLNHLFVTPREKNQGKFVTPEGVCVVRRIRVKGSFTGLPIVEIVEFNPNDPVVLAVPIKMSKQNKSSTRRRPALPNAGLFSGSQESLT
ncbi:hypothetical protein FRX31_025496, partial [Thalictrum thalictroides]